MKALTDETRLIRSLRLKPGHSTDVIETLSDAALFIYKLPQQTKGELHWQNATNALEAAADKPGNQDLLHGATNSMENALKTNQMLREGAG
jgi:hypothetical protein